MKNIPKKAKIAITGLLIGFVLPLLVNYLNSIKERINVEEWQEKIKIIMKELRIEDTLKILKKKKNPKITDLNEADTASLMELPYIGSFRAKKIIEYREKLGGFYSIEQLLEVPTIDSTILEKIYEFIIVDTSNSKIRKIKINSCSLDELAKHPYVKYRMAKAIKNYIFQHGPIKNAREFNEVIPLPDSNKRKILPYLEFD